MKFRSFTALLLGGAMTLSLLTGCSSGTTDTTTDTTTTTTETTTTETEPVAIVTQAVTEFQIDEIDDIFLALSGVSGDTVVATAGEIEITAAEFLSQVAYTADELLYTYASYGIDELPWETEGSTQTLVDALTSDALNSATLYAFYPTVAEREGYTLSEDIILQAAELIATEMESLGDEEVAQYTLWCIPLTEELYMDWLLSESYYAVVGADYVGDTATQSRTDDEYLAYAEDAGYYRVQHILLTTISTEVNEEGTGYVELTEEDYEAKYNQAADLLAQIQAADDPYEMFETLMNQYSEDGRDATTGQLSYPEGYTAYPSQMSEYFEAAATALDEYEISEVIQTEYGFHIMLRLPLEMTDDLRTAMESAYLYDTMTEWMAEFDPVGNDVLESIDLQIYYENLTTLRAQIVAVLDELEG